MSLCSCSLCGHPLPRATVAELPPLPELLSCPGCGLVGLRALPSAECRKALYQEDYYDAEQGDRFLGPLELAVRFFRWRRKRDLLRFWSAAADENLPHSFLDIGCGRGQLVDFLAAAGFAAMGTQLSETAARAARARGSDVRVGELRQLSLAAGFCGLAVLYHVLEHLEDPLDELREIHRLLAPGGLLVVEVPSFDRPGARLLGLRDLCIDYPHHLYFFKPADVRALLTAAGFEILDESFFSLEYSPVTTLQNLLNLLPGRPNRLLDALRRNAAATALRRSPITALHFVLALPLAPLALLLSLLGLLLPIGNTYRVYTRRIEAAT